MYEPDAAVAPPGLLTMSWSSTYTFTTSSVPATASSVYGTAEGKRISPVAWNEKSAALIPGGAPAAQLYTNVAGVPPRPVVFAAGLPAMVLFGHNDTARFVNGVELPSVFKLVSNSKSVLATGGVVHVPFGSR